MTFFTLISRSLRFNARSHLGVVLGAAIGTAALVGALVVGDSVRASLLAQAEARVGWVVAAMNPPDRQFSQDLAQRLVRSPAGAEPGSEPAAPGRISSILRLPGTAVTADGSARANQVFVMGVASNFWISAGPLRWAEMPAQGVVLNAALATQLRATVGDEILLRFRKPSALAQDVPLAPRGENSRTLRLNVHAVVGADNMGNFDLAARPGTPFNAFVRLEELANAVGLSNRANLLLVGSALESRAGASPLASRDEESLRALNSRVRRSLVLDDLELELKPATTNGFLELQTRRVFLDPTVVAAAGAAAPAESTVADLRSWLASPDGMQAAQSLQHPMPVLTYLVNLLRHGDQATPYSMVAAAGAPWTRPDQAANEMVVNEWLAEDLQIKAGDSVQMTYFRAESAGHLVEVTNEFRVAEVVPLRGEYADARLMPDFPGISKAESTHDWDAGFPLTHKIREKDDQYWKRFRGTPKAFIPFGAGQTLWSNRFGAMTSVRWALPSPSSAEPMQHLLSSRLVQNLEAGDFGFRFDGVRARALAGAAGAEDFGGLFVGFSFFLIGAALILMALLFQFHLETRSGEVGILLAVGFRPKQIRRLLLGEGLGLAMLGGLVGAAGGVAYAWKLVDALNTRWRDAIASTSLSFHATPTSVAIGLLSGVIVCFATFAWVLRRQGRLPVRALLEGVGSESAATASSSAAWVGWVAAASLATAGGTVGWALATGRTADAELFFSAGSLLLIGALSGCAFGFGRLARRARGESLTLFQLGLRGCVRRRARSVATISLLASGSFVVMAIGAFRLDADLDAGRRSAGTGGFALIAQTALPVVQDLDSAAGRDFFGLPSRDLAEVAVVPMRVRDGDEASCLNLNQAQKPRLLGVDAKKLAERGAFTFAGVADGFALAQGWNVLRSGGALAPDEVRAVGDAGSIEWALKKKLGDTLSFTDDHGREFKIRLVASVANSILQGNLVIDEADFIRRFPNESGYRMFLIDAPSNRVAQVAAEWSRGLQDVGAELTPTAAKLAQFNAVQNTYLNTFQVLGGLGLLLGSAGLGIVVLRNVFDRRAELGLLRAVGFRRRVVLRMLLTEHAVLLMLGLAVGALAAGIAVLPALVSPGAGLPTRSLALTLAGVVFSGLVWTGLATTYALRGNLLRALRNE